MTLSREQAFRDLEPIGMSLLSAAHSMRGDRATSARALELGGEATALWPKGERQPEYAHHIHILGNPLYWSGRYQEAYELAMEAKAMGGLTANGAEFVLRGAGMTGLTLAGLGRYEEALEARSRRSLRPSGWAGPQAS